MYRFADDPIAIEITGGSSAPWWGVPVIAGGFLVLGAILGFIFNRLNDRRRERREDSTKWHSLVRELSAEIITHTDRVWELRGQASEPRPMTFGAEEARQKLAIELRAATNSLRDKANELMLLAPKDLSLAVGMLVHKTIHDENKENAAQIDEHSAVRRAFTDAVRQYLEIDPS